MGDGVGHNTMGLLTVCTGITWGREKRMQFDGYGIATTGPLSHIWDIVTCVMEIIWREMIDSSGHIVHPLHHIGCAMAAPTKNPIW